MTYIYSEMLSDAPSGRSGRYVDGEPWMTSPHRGNCSDFAINVCQSSLSLSLIMTSKPPNLQLQSPSQYCIGGCAHGLKTPAHMSHMRDHQVSALFSLAASTRACRNRTGKSLPSHGIILPLVVIRLVTFKNKKCHNQTIQWLLLKRSQKGMSFAFHKIYEA